MVLPITQKRRGFTLIELLVVITIVGILMVIIYVNFDASRKNARDKIRQTTLADLQLAIEQYKTQIGLYPPRPQGCGVSGEWVTHDTQYTTGATVAGRPIRVCANNFPFIYGIAPGFIPSLPDRTEAVGQKLLYYVNNDRTAYKLIAFDAIESQKNRINGYTDTKKFAACPSQCVGFSGANPVLCDASGPAPTTYAVYSVGGECL